MEDSNQVNILNDEGSENSTRQTLSNSTKIVDLSKQLYRQVLKLKGKFLQDSGKVDYSSLRESPDFQQFKLDCTKLKLVDLTSSNDVERKAFFLNVYNILTTHALSVSVKDELTVLQLPRVWQAYAYKIGTQTFSLDDIEHGILRCNAVHPTSKESFFKEGDPRMQFIQPVLDPRIHFALNCGAKSCPPIRLFSSENLEDALDLAAKNFCQNDIFIDTTKSEIIATKILMWYGHDFGPDEKAVMQAVSPYLTSQQQADLEKIIDKFKLNYSEYDWSIY